MYFPEKIYVNMNEFLIAAIDWYDWDIYIYNHSD